jgi:predicted PurR-regulated permease PerM
LLFGALFGFLGLLLADSMLATLKVGLQEISRFRTKSDAGDQPQVVAAGGGPA